MSLQGLNESNFGPLTNTNFSNFTTLDLNNASTTVIDFHYHFHQFWILMFWVSFFGLITNSSFILTVVKTPSLHSTTYILLTCLACSDCIILMLRLEAIAGFLLHYTRINAGITTSGCLLTMCFLLSTGFVILASEERYLAICKPLTHRRIKTTRRTAKVIAVVFFTSAAIVGLFVPILQSCSVTRICIIWQKGDEFHEYLNEIVTPKPDIWINIYRKIFYVALGVFFSLILASVSYMYAKILATLANRKRNTNLQMSTEFKRHIEQVSLMVIINGGVYFLLTFIVIIYFILNSFSFTDMISLMYCELAVYASTCVNASVNPLLYFLTNERYRCAVRTMFRSGFRKACTPQNTQ